MKTLALTQGKTTVIDDEDWELVKPYTWCAHRSKGKWYAETTFLNNGRRKVISMHRMVMRMPPFHETREWVDHWDRDGLNNVKSNLRRCTNGQNCMNRAATRKNGTGLKGVSFDKQYGCFKARICVNYKQIYLGYFRSPEDAACAYNIASLKYHGPFGYQNRI